jgi:peptidoglycan-N-acetylglucosamine deacetylase
METRGFLLDHPILGKLKKPSNAQPVLGSKRSSTSTPSRMISVIIPAHNEERYLLQTLDALSRQNYGWYEVIVVANGCTDKTAEVARGHCQRLVVLSQKSLGVARNLGARMAKGELLLFLDADTTLEPMALRRIAEEFTPEDAAGTVVGRPDSARRLYRVFYFVKNAIHRSRLHCGSSGVILCWKKDFERIGGFDEGLEVRENSVLIKRLKCFGRYKFIADVNATTSMRRYDQRGFHRMAWLWIKLWVQSLFGDLHRRHYDIVR